MSTVRMKHGGFHPRVRQDGQVWPAYNGTIEVGDEEASDLVAAGIAVYEDDEPVPVHEGFSTLYPMVPGYREPDPEPEGDAYDEEPASTRSVQESSDSPARKPYGNASKDAWVKYAISQGADAEEAKAMTKAELLSAYGASL